MKNNSYINLDTNAGWGTDPELWHYLEAVLKDCANPSSVHQAGQRARSLIEEAREDIKQLLGIKDARVIFTSGASEANNLILHSIFSDKRCLEKSHLVISAIEHISALEPAKRLETEGLKLSVVFPKAGNAYTSSDFYSQLTPETKMISLMYANNETGDILPLEELTRKVNAERPDIFIFSDVVQALGKTEFNFTQSGLDAVSISGHKIGALPGTGALVMHDDYRVSPLILGGPQEGRLRAGTENLPGIVSFGYMARKIQKEASERTIKMMRSKELLSELLFTNLKGIIRNSTSTETLPNTLNIQIPGIRSDDLVVALDLEGILISSAAACSSGKPLPSHVLLAYGLTEEEARRSVRISLPDNLSVKQVRHCASKISECVNRMRHAAVPKRLENHVS